MSVEEQIDHDAGPRLKKYLESTHQIRAKSGPVRSSLVLPSGTILYARGSRELKDPNRLYGYYHLVKRNYEELINNSKAYFAVVYSHPKKTFVLTGPIVKRFFENERLVSPSNRPKWEFKIVRGDGKYILDFDRKGSPTYDITEYLNKWHLIEDFRGKEVVQVGEEEQVDDFRRRLLDKGVSEMHIKILKKFHKNCGKYLSADKIYGEKKNVTVKKTPLPPDEDIDQPHYMHNLILCFISNISFNFSWILRR